MQARCGGHLVLELFGADWLTRCWLVLAVVGMFVRMWWNICRILWKQKQIKIKENMCTYNIHVHIHRYSYIYIYASFLGG